MLLIGVAMTRKVSVIFTNLYQTYQEIGKFDVKISVIPNGLEEYMAFTINKNLVFIDSMQFMNSCLDVLVKNLTDNDFKYLSQKLSREFFKISKTKRTISI